MTTAADIMKRAGILLNDEDHIRWTLPELAGWINDGCRAIVLARPAAKSGSRILTLEEGTLQKVPESGANAPLSLLKIVRNLKTADESPRVGGRVIKRTDQMLLDSQNPSWHDSTSVPFKKEVRNYVFDDTNPLEFYVYPGNDGTGIVEAAVSEVPAKIVASGAADQEASYTSDIDLPETYDVPLLDYVIYRAQSKDDETGQGGRAAMHYQQFATALGINIQVAKAYSPNASPSS